MATTGYKRLTGTADLSTLFDTYVSGTQANPTGYKLANGNDLSTRFAPYVSGTQVTATGYKLANGDDISTLFAPIIASFPTAQSSVPGIGNNVCVSMDGSNCVICCQGGAPAGDTYTFLYWSNDFGATLTKATIGGVINQKFFGCVAISGQNAIAMGRLTSAGTNNFYLSSDYGKTYTMSATAGTGAGSGGLIAMSGANAVWTAYQTNVYLSTNYGATWTSKGLYGNNVEVKMYGNNVYISALNNGLQYSTNGGSTFTKSTLLTTCSCVTQCGTNLYIAGPNIIYKSTNNGATGSVVWNNSLIGNLLGMGSSPNSNPTLTNDFLIIANDGGGTYGGKFHYSNNASGTVPTFTQVAIDIRTPSIYANTTRIIAGGYTGLNWGRNSYIT